MRPHMIDAEWGCSRSASAFSAEVDLEHVSGRAAHAFTHQFGEAGDVPDPHDVHPLGAGFADPDHPRLRPHIVARLVPYARPVFGQSDPADCGEAEDLILRLPVAFAFLPGAVEGLVGEDMEGVGEGPYLFGSRCI
jgi:hypothetical protein